MVPLRCHRLEVEDGTSLASQLQCPSQQLFYQSRRTEQARTGSGERDYRRLTTSMSSVSSAESLDISRPDYDYAAAKAANSLNKNKYTVLKLDEESIFQMEAAKTALEDYEYEDFTAGEVAHLGAQPSSGLVYHSDHEAAAPGSLVSLLSQAFFFLNKTAIDVYRTLAIPQALGVGPPGLDILLDNTKLQQEQDSTSRLCFTHTCNTRQRQPCKPYEDEGLLTLIFIDQPAGLQVYPPTDTAIHIPGGYVAVLPGYTLEHATCGLFKACKYRLDFLGFPQEDCSALTFELKAPPTVTLNLYDELPTRLKPQIPPRYHQPITVGDLVWNFDQLQQSDSTTETPDNDLGVLSEANKFTKDPNHNVRAFENDMIGTAFDNEDAVVYSTATEKRWSIAIVQPWGNVQPLTVCTDWKVLKIKEFIQAMTGITCQNQQLTYAGKQLPSYASILEADLRNGCHVNLVIQPCKRSEPRSLVQLYIKSLMSKQLLQAPYPIWVNLKHTVGQLKELLQLVLGHHHNNQRLMFAGKQLMSEYKLHDYGLKAGYTVYLLVTKLPSA